MMNGENIRIVSAIIIILVIAYVMISHKPKPKSTPRKSYYQYRYIDYRRDHAKKIKKTRKKLKNKHSKKRLMEIIQVAQHYQNGVLDSYDVAGRKIKGVEPNAKESIKYYSMAAKMGYMPAMIEIARIYHYGCGKQQPDLKQAISIYSMLINSDTIRSNEKLYSIVYKELNDSEDSLRVSTPPSRPIINNSTTTYNLPAPISNLPNVAPHQGGFRIGGSSRARNAPTTTVPVPFDQIVRTQGIAPMNPIFDAMNFLPDDALPAGIINETPGAHNTHDSTVLASIRKSLQAMDDQTQMNRDIQTCFKEIREQINDYAHNDKRKDAHKALDAMERDILTLPNMGGKTESQVIQTVWNRIHDPKNNDHQTVQVENLIDNLADSVKPDGTLHCPTGRTTRAVSSLEGSDPEVRIQSTDAINTELLNKASKIREDLFESKDAESQKQIDSIEDNEVQNNFQKEFKQKINDTFQKDYVDSGLLKKNQLDNMVGKWIDHV